MGKLFIVLILGLLLVGSVSATSVNYYFHPQCGHCKTIEPFINQMIRAYSNIKWNILDVTQGSYNIQGTPTLILTTNDCRKITLVGSQEIPQWLECELNEQSNLNCPTYSALEGTKNGSWFIR